MYTTRCNTILIQRTTTSWCIVSLLPFQFVIQETRLYNNESRQLPRFSLVHVLSGWIQYVVDALQYCWNFSVSINVYCNNRRIATNELGSTQGSQLDSAVVRQSILDRKGALWKSV